MARAATRRWAVLAVGVASLAAVAVPVRGASASLAWSPCLSKFRCAVLSVPANYNKPSAGHISLSLIELPASGPSPIGAIVMNPGGPGASGITFLDQTAQDFPAALRRDFTLVSFDPRGIGASDPVSCTNAAGERALIALDPAPRTKAQIRKVVAGLKSFVRSCERHTPARVLRNMSSVDTARDLDRIRAALGEPKLNYLGFSYGTYLGELYAQRFPHKFRALVLDGVVDPAQSPVNAARAQAVAFEKDLHDFYAWCPTNASCAKEFPHGIGAATNRLIARLKGGATITAHLAARFGGTVKITYGVLLTALVASLYAKQQWPGLARAIAQGAKGNGVALAAAAYSYEGLQQNGRFTNLVAANTATSCEDSRGPTTVARVTALAAQFAKVAPVFGASEAWSMLTCAYWPTKPRTKPAPVVNRGENPILVVGSTGDPATPYAAAKKVTTQLRKAVLLTRTGPGHTAYFFSSCIRSWTDRYFTSVTLPPSGTTCPTG